MSDGDHLDVKKELNAGEYMDLITELSLRKPFSKILAYVVGWSFVGLDGQPLPYDLDLDEETRRNTVRSLNKATLRELVAVLDRHELAEESALEAKKKTLPSPTASSPPSASAAP
jgi:hypothetical protein